MDTFHSIGRLDMKKPLLHARELLTGEKGINGKGSSVPVIGGAHLRNQISLRLHHRSPTCGPVALAKIVRNCEASLAMGLTSDQARLTAIIDLPFSSLI